MAKRIVVGLMSGTSMDRVDAAVVEIQGTGEKSQLNPLSFAGLAYPDTLEKRLFMLCRGTEAGRKSSVSEISAVNFLIAEHFARAALKAIRKAGLSPSRVDLIGSHGQTIYHRPRGREPSTLQLGEPAVIAERTGITTVADFRPADIAAGGEGAPLTPYAHYLLFRDRKRSRAIHNLGGISNLTYLPAEGAPKDVAAFDTGPANMVLDGLCRWMTKGKKTFDRRGVMAGKGTVRQDLLKRLLRHPFFSRRPPKSTGREEFGEPFVLSLRRLAKRRKIRPIDLLATATALTASSIGRAYREFVLRRLGKVDEIYISGGGRKNRTLMAMLQRELQFSKVSPIEELAFDGDALEAQAFALLANEAVEGLQGNLPRVTGARRGVILGKIVPGRNYRGVKLKTLK